MITNKTITYYSKSLDENRLEAYTKIVFNKAWVFSGLGSSINKGYVDANKVDIRIPMNEVADTTIFKIGDIVAIGETPNIEKQADLVGSEFYNITSININDFGHNPHIHLGGQ